MMSLVIQILFAFVALLATGLGVYNAYPFGSQPVRRIRDQEPRWLRR